jgi:hypothetical protein
MLEIYQGFRAALTALPDAPPIAYLNQSFESNDLYLREGFNPAETVTNTLADEGHKEYTGFYAVNIVCPLESGFYPAQVLADQIVNHFNKGKVIGGARVTKAWSSPNITTDEHFILPITIRYKAVK